MTAVPSARRKATVAASQAGGRTRNASRRWTRHPVSGSAKTACSRPDGPGAILGGPAVVARDFVGVDVGVSRVAESYDEINWLLPEARVVDALFAAYFENEQDITDHGVLRAAAVAAGLDEAEVRAWLESDGGGKEVDVEVLNAQRRGISSVPNFTIQKAHQLSGARDESAFLEIFDLVKAAEN